MDYIESGKLSVTGIKFFVLDEADRLLDTGNRVSWHFQAKGAPCCFFCQPAVGC